MWIKRGLGEVTVGVAESSLPSMMILQGDFVSGVGEGLGCQLGMLGVANIQGTARRSWLMKVHLGGDMVGLYFELLELVLMF